MALLRIPWERVQWTSSIFLMLTLLVSVIGVPIYIWQVGLDWFQVALFLVFFAATGLSITLGYHRLFSHRTFQATWPVRWLTLVFGAAAFENSALVWSEDHRRHHKFVDQDDDPYDISKGFWHAHIGWIMFKLAPEPPLRYVDDLRRDPLVMWQHLHFNPIALLTGFMLPLLLGWWWGGDQGALGGFLLAGVARTVLVQHFTFFINSLCHTIGRQPYSSRCTARDSSLMAFLTFGEGYHNFHHTFPYDYRNGIKPWHFDPTKWSIWLLQQLRLASQLRRVPTERIILAEIAETQQVLAEAIKARPKPLAAPVHSRWETAQIKLQDAYRRWEQHEIEYRKVLDTKIEASREKLAQIQQDFQTAKAAFHQALRDWQEAHQLVLAQLA